MCLERLHYVQGYMSALSKMVDELDFVPAKRIRSKTQLVLHSDPYMHIFIYIYVRIYIYIERDR